MENLTPLATVLVFTTLNEALIEYFIGGVANLRRYIPLIALTTGVLLAVFYQINFFTLILGFEETGSIVDYLLSGFIISRGSNFVNDFTQKFLGGK